MQLNKSLKGFPNNWRSDISMIVDCYCVLYMIYEPECDKKVLAVSFSFITPFPFLSPLKCPHSPPPLVLTLASLSFIFQRHPNPLLHIFITSTLFSHSTIFLSIISHSFHVLLSFLSLPFVPIPPSSYSFLPPFPPPLPLLQRKPPTEYWPASLPC